MNELLEAALEYAKNGYSVIPIKPQGKTPLVPWKRFQTEKADEEQIRNWWNESPNANVGLVTGKISGFTIVDIDGEVGESSVRDFGLDLPATRGVKSPKGRHLYYRYTPALRTVAGVLPNVDVRNDGGVIVAPPSRRSEGSYDLVVDQLLAPLDSESIQLLSATRRKPKRTNSTSSGGGGQINEGQRNESVFSFALQQAREGRSREELVEILSAYNQKNFVTPLDQSEVVKTVNSAWKHFVERSGMHLAGHLLIEAEQLDSNSPIYDAITKIARLKISEYLKLKSEFKDSDRSIPLTDLDAAVKDERRRLEKTQAEDGAVDDLPTVQIQNRSSLETVQECLAVLKQRSLELRLFQMSGVLYRIQLGGSEAKTVPLNEFGLMSLLVESMNFVRGAKKIFPTRDVLKTILGRVEYPFYELKGISYGPVWRSNGRLVTDPGYDRETGIFLVSTDLAEVSHEESAGDRAVEDARQALEEFFGDFPFDGTADYENTVALLITLVYQPSVGMRVPLAVINSPQPGSGKSLLVDLLCLIAHGRNAPFSVAPRDDEEMRKRITSNLVASRPIEVFDNFIGEIKSTALTVAMTTDRYNDRLLGSSTAVELPNKTIRIATGNNVFVGGDLVRRTFSIRLDARHAAPWTRSNFKIDDIAAHALKNRSKLLSAAVTLIDAWHDAGRPTARDSARMGSFEPWRLVIGGIMENAGYESFLANLDSWWGLMLEDSSAWEGWLTIWYSAIGMKKISGRQLLSKLHGEGSDPKFRSVVPDDVSDLLERYSSEIESVRAARALSHLLTKRSGQTFGRLRISRSHDRSTNKSMWALTEV